MPDVAFNMAAQPDEVVRAYQEIVESQKKAEDGARQFGKASEQSWEISDKSWQKMKSAPSDFSVAMGGVQQAVGLASTAIVAFGAFAKAELEGMKERANKATESVTELDKALSRTGQISLLPEIEASIEQISSKTMSNKQLKSLFGEIHAEAKGALSTEQELGALREAALASAAGKDEKTFAKSFVKLQTGIMGDSSKEQISDAVTQLMDVLPGGLDQGHEKFLGRAQASGIDANTALRLITASARSEEGPKALSRLLDEATADIDISTVARKKEFTPEAKAEMDRMKDEDLAADKRRLELDTVDLGATKWQKQQHEEERNEMRLGEQRRNIRKKELEDSKTEVISEDDERKMRLAKIPKEQRLAAMLADPTLSSGKASILNLKGAVADDEFTTGGQFGFDLADRQKTINRDPRLRAMAERKALSIDVENYAERASIGDLEGSLAVERGRFAEEKLDRKSAARRALRGFSLALPGGKAGESLKDYGEASMGAARGEGQASLDRMANAMEATANNTTKRGISVVPPTSSTNR